MALNVERFVIPVAWEGGHTLHVAVKRYTSSKTPPSPRGVTIILTHGVTFREFITHLLASKLTQISLDKELWEPVLTRLFELPTQYGNPLQIREAWTIDSPNHGESAALNDHVLGSTTLISKSLNLGIHCATLFVDHRSSRSISRICSRHRFIFGKWPN